MFLRCKVRRKDGKQHRYWSVVENTRVAGGRVVQRHVLYLGEINDTQELAWRRSIEVLEEGATQPRTLSLFPRRPLRRSAGGRLDRPRQAVAVAVAPAAAVGCVLADATAVAKTAAGSVLVKRFLAPKVAELVEGTGEEAVLDSHRADVVVFFCGLRGFTAFAGNAEADE